MQFSLHILTFLAFAWSTCAAICAGNAYQGIVDNAPSKDTVTKLYALRQNLCGGNPSYANCGGLDAQNGGYNNGCYQADPSSTKLQAVMWGNNAGTVQSCWDGFDQIIKQCFTTAWGEEDQWGSFGSYTYNGNIYIMTIVGGTG